MRNSTRRSPKNCRWIQHSGLVRTGVMRKSAREEEVPIPSYSAPDVVKIRLPRRKDRLPLKPIPEPVVLPEELPGGCQVDLRAPVECGQWQRPGKEGMGYALRLGRPEGIRFGVKSRGDGWVTDATVAPRPYLTHITVYVIIVV